MSNETLGDYGDIGDIFGMDEFGYSSPMHPLVGVAIGGAASVLGKKYLGQYTSPTFGGALGGIAVGAALWLAKQQQLGLIAAGTAVVLSGLQAVFGSMGLSGVVLEPTHQVLGLPSIEKGYAVNGASLNGNGLGAPMRQQAQLVGNGEVGDESGFAAAQNKLSLLGGPNVSSLASHFGANLFGTNR